MSRWLRLAAWSAFLVLTLRLLHGPAFGHLSMPLGSFDELAAWAIRTAPSAMALAVARLAAIAAAWYLAGATVLAVAADLAGWRPMSALVAALSPAVVRRLASRSAGVGLAAGALLAVTPMPTRLAAAPADATTRQAVPPQPPTATMTRLPGTPPPTTAAPATMTRLPATPPAGTTPAGPPARLADLTLPEDSAAPSMTRLPGAAPTETAQPGTLPGSSASTPPTMTRLAAAEPVTEATRGTATMARLPGERPRARPASTTADEDPAALWPVAQGDSFWSIAFETLTDHLGHGPTDDDVLRYWRHLIAANRHRLLDPANCDLLVPGQQLELPPPA